MIGYGIGKIILKLHLYFEILIEEVQEWYVNSKLEFPINIESRQTNTFQLLGSKIIILNFPGLYIPH